MTKPDTQDARDLPDDLNMKQISALFRKGPEWFGKNRADLIARGFPKPHDWPGRKLWDREAVERWLEQDGQATN